MATKRHIRQVVHAWKKMGCKVRPIRRSPGHPVFEVTLPDGRIKRVPMSGSPKNEDHANRAAIRQIQDAIDGKDKNV